jgi:hypothetical protein
MGATRGRRIGVLTLLVLATIIAILGMTAVWVQRQVLEREEWVDTSVELLEDEDVREALGVYMIDELYANVDVAAEIEQGLPRASSRSPSRPRVRRAVPPRKTPPSCSARRPRSRSGGGRTNGRTTCSTRCSARTPAT